MRDTILSRMKAIEALVGGDCSFDIDCFVTFEPEKYSKEKILEKLKLANSVISEVYHLSHGHLSDCCKGKGANLIEPLVSNYFGKSGRRTNLKKLIKKLIKKVN